ncbi:MAG: hypothetical protein KGI50_04995, partial [Patescibacteria group bacterium]|nr:hypothetical protein [Patescibacteria group bacterium]
MGRTINLCGFLFHIFFDKSSGGSIKQMVSLIGIFPSSVQDFQRFHPDEIASKILTPDLRACIVSHDDTFF